MVRRSALNSAQISALTSSMISSTLFVAWILLVTACSCFWNARRALTADCAACELRTALIDCPPYCCLRPSLLARPSMLDPATMIYNEFSRSFSSASGHFLQTLSTSFGDLQSALQHPHLEAPLSEQERRSGAAPPALAVGHVFL